MSVQYLTNTRARYSDGTGKPLSQGTVGVYVAGTSFGIQATIWDTADKSTELPNPVTLDDAGEAEIWYDVEVDIQIKDSAGALQDTALGLDPNANETAQTGFNLATNGSFEIDSNNDGQPDSWTTAPYSGSKIAITNDIVTHGTAALEFNTDASGAGGGSALSSKFPVTEGSVLSISWSFYATSANTINFINIKWYDEDNVYQSTTTPTMPSTGSVPTSWTNYQEEITAAAGATQGEIVLNGITSSSSSKNAKAYFDGISIVQLDGLVSLGATQTLTNKTLTSPVLTSPVINVSVSGTAIGRGCLVTLSADEAIANASNVHVSWDSETGGYDTDTIHDTATNNKRLTVPTGVTKVRISAQIVWESNATGVRRITLSKNDETTTPTTALGTPSNWSNASDGVHVNQFCSPIIEVVATDYFTLSAYQSSGGSLNVDATAAGFGESWFSMEIIK